MQKACWPKPTIRYSYGTSANEISRCITAANPNHIVLWGSELSPGSHAVLAITDSVGQLKGYRKFGNSGSGEGFVAKATDSALYLVGATRAGLGQDNVFFMKTRLDGTPIWQRLYQGRGSRAYPYGLNRTRSGEWLIAVCHDYFTAEIYKLDSNGNMLWRREMTFGSLTNQLYQIQETRDGGIAVCGMVDNLAFLMKLDGNGNTLWTRTLGGGSLYSAKSFVELPDGQYFINGYMVDASRQVLMARLSATGQLRWLRKLTRGNEEDVNYGCFLDTDGNLVLTGYTFPASQAQTDLVMGKFTPNGRMLWGKTQSSTFDEGVDNGPNHTIRLGNYYYTTGFANGPTQGQPSFNMLLLRYRAETNTPCLPNDYQLTTLPDTNVVAGAPTWSAGSLAPLADLGLPLAVTQPLACALNCTGNVFANPLGPNRVICPGVGLDSLNAGNPGSNYLWNTGATTQKILPTRPGQYWVQVTNGCGTFTDTISIIERPSPRLPIDSSGPLRFCVPGSVRLVVRGAPAGFVIRWSNGLTDSAINVATSGIYSAVLTYPSGCAFFTDTVRVIALGNPFRPIVSPQGPINLCQPGPRQLTVTNARLLDRYTWSTGQPGITLTVNQPKGYWVTSLSPEGCPRNSDTVMAFIGPGPVLSSPPQTICFGDNAVLGQPEQAGLVYRWRPSACLSDSTAAQPTWINCLPSNPAGPVVFTFKTYLAGTHPGCPAMDTTQLTVYPQGYGRATELLSCQPPLEIPNVVTPGQADGMNDAFRVKNLEYYPDNVLHIYNRFGRLVHKAAPYGNAWPAADTPPGVYFIRLEVPSRGWITNAWLELVR